jgi:general secretion pathway protein D
MAPIHAVYRGPFDATRLKEMMAIPESDRRIPERSAEAVAPLFKPVITHYTLRFIHPTDLKQVLGDMFPDAKFSADVRNRSCTYLSSAEDRDKIMSLIKELDCEPDQIQLQVQIIECGSEFTDSLKKWLVSLANGLSWRVDLSQLSLIPKADMDGFIQVLKTSGTASLIAKPTITTRDNQKATVKVGDQIPYLTTVITDRTTSVQVNQVDTGVELEVLPQVSPDDVVQIDIKAAISHIKYYRELGGGQYPVVTHRMAETHVNIPDGQTLVIAGLVDDQYKVSRTSVPGLSDIPLLGSVFRGDSEERVTNDVVILISPKIIRVKKKEALR